MRIDEAMIQASEEVAQEFPSINHARELIRSIDEFTLRISTDLASTTRKERIRYRAMYNRLAQLSGQIGDDVRPPHDWVFESVVFLDLDEKEIPDTPSFDIRNPCSNCGAETTGFVNCPVCGLEVP